MRHPIGECGCCAGASEPCREFVTPRDPCADRNDILLCRTLPSLKLDAAAFSVRRVKRSVFPYCSTILRERVLFQNTCSCRVECSGHHVPSPPSPRVLAVGWFSRVPLWADHALPDHGEVDARNASKGQVSAGGRRDRRVPARQKYCQIFRVIYG